MSEQVRPKFNLRDFLGYLLAYWFWLMGAAIAMVAIFMIRQMINVMWPAVGGNRWVMRAIDRFALVFMGLVWLVYAIFAEQYFRTAITQVRERRHRARYNPSPNPPPEPKTSLMRHLHKIGLDILAQRVVYGVGIPLLILAVAFGLYQLAFWILQVRL